MEFRLLGQVEAYRSGQRLALGPRQQRLVLAVLALDVNRLLPLDRLVSLVWPVDPPRTAAHSIQVCVSRLRSVLSRSDVDSREVSLAGSGEGYALRADPARIDVYQFRDLVERAGHESDDRRRVELLDRALDLWSGPALTGAAPPELRDRLCGGLEEARLVAMEDRFDAQLRLRRHAVVIDELTTVVNTHPTRERPAGQLMLALYRSGHANEALAVYRSTRSRMIEELGIEPGPDMRRLETGILRNAAELASPRAASTVVADHGSRVPRATSPAQLPPAVAGFTGRATEHAQLDALVAEHADSHTSPLAVAIVGTAGVGKTALAVQWAHRNRDRFPDGQLYVDLGGYAPRPARPPIEVLAGFLHAFGVPGPEVPRELDEATALYRTLLADRTMLVVLDNAHDTDQVRPLLPGSPRSTVLITSRDRLGGLVCAGLACRLRLDLLDTRNALAVLARILGDARVAAHPDAAAQLVDMCGRLPTALRIAAAVLAEHPDRDIAEYVRELEAGGPFTTLERDGDERQALHATFDWSYHAMDPAAQRLFRLLSLLDGSDVTRLSASILMNTTTRRAGQLLKRLAAKHLVIEQAPDRYELPGLLRGYALEQAGADDGEAAERQAAVRRLLAADPGASGHRDE